MNRLKSIAGILFLLGGASFGFGADAGHGPPVSPAAPTLWDLGEKLGLPFPIPITNSMVYTWIIMALLFIVLRLGTRIRTNFFLRN